MQNDERNTLNPKTKALVEGFRRSKRSKAARTKARARFKAKLNALRPASAPQK